MSLKEETHINTIHDLWVITPHGAIQHLGMLILMHEMTSTLLSDHLPPLPCILWHINCLLHLTMLTLTQSLASAPMPQHLCHKPSLCFHTPSHDLHSLPCLRS
ncbi:hypothetical protein O181_089809 [Austropuccinia psidii MF-1]|uniref:Uncharacterized protein n=1 Tax=Austropuccinia psidii MF-1 TaxID=1389203 RepID=A0A9Q3IU91_9BASI|nr:hypothetical protein [Austropuccinia psidii MF-1]